MLVREIYLFIWMFSGAQLTLATIYFLLQKLDKLMSLTLFGFPPFQDPGLQEAYGKAYREVYGVSLCFPFFPAGGEGPRLASNSLCS
jgi:hypothetical protein